MWKHEIFTLLALCCLVASSVGYESYSGYKIYDIVPRSTQQRDLLYELSQNYDELDFFIQTKLLNRPVRILVPPALQSVIGDAISKNALEYYIVNADVAKSVHEERRLAKTFFKPPASSGKIDLTKYHRLAEINAYLELLAKNFSSRVSLVNAGKSHEGRQLKYLKITNGDGKTNKTVIFVDAGIHAREWIAPATALVIINQLVENFTANKHLLASYDWHVLPVLNPDGYEYTHTTSRFWRKTRRPSSSTCVGTDANRNFDFHWGETGASSQPCSDTFKGEKAFSEPETAILKNLLHSLENRGKMYLTLHSYGNLLLYPWGYGPELPPTWRDLDEVSRAGGDAIRNATGTNYTVGSSTNVLYAAAGASDDYAFGAAKFPISITMELPGGGSGFDPPASQIKPYTEEAWIGIKAMAEKVIVKY